MLVSNYFFAPENEGLCIKIILIQKQFIYKFRKTLRLKAES